MADKVILEGNYPGGEMFRFTLDNMSTYDQMQRLIELTGSMANKLSRKDPEEQKRVTGLIAGNRAQQTYKSTLNNTSSSLSDFGDTLIDVRSAGTLLKGDFKGLTGVLRGVNNPLVMLGSAASSMVGALMGYAESLRPALQRGIGGAVMDFAIYSKSAGMSMDAFTKALIATEGTFGMLGRTQNEAAKNFSSLINSVRKTTAEFGNLGMSNEELAKFTADQLKIAVQQGVRGRAAQERVIAMSKELGGQFQELAQRTGKSTSELAQMATKLVQDPTINNFINTLKSGGTEVSKAMQSFGSSMGALFGKQGEELANVAAQTAVSNVPLAMDKIGEGLIRVMPNYARELETMSRKAAQGLEPTEEDRQRLKAIFEQEYKDRQKNIQFLKYSGDAELQAAAQRVEQMYQSSRQYDTEDTKRRKKEADAAQEFNSQVNQLTATMHQLMVPLLQMLNAVDWNVMFDVLNGFASTVKTITETVLGPIANVIEGTGGGKVVGALLALATVAGVVGSAFLVLRNAAVALTAAFRLLRGSPMGGAGRTPGPGVPPTGPGVPPAGPGKPPAGGMGDLARRERELAAARTAEQDKLKARSDELYKKYRAEGLTASEAKRRADAHAAYQPNKTLGERVESAKNSETAGRLKNFVKDWGPTIGLMMAGYAGSRIAEAGEAKLEEDPESLMAKLQVGVGNTLDFVGTWGSTILFTSQIMKDYFPEALDKVKSFGSGALEIAKKHLPDLGDKLKTFGRSLGDWSTKLMNSPLMGKLGSAAVTVGVAAAGGFVVDAAAGAMGVGQEITEEDKKKDRENWERMSVLEKAESGVARTVETIGGLFGLGNIVSEAEKKRIATETEYLRNKKIEEENWNKMTSLQKAESGMARTIETVAATMGLGDLIQGARRARIKTETDFLAKQELEETSTAAVDKKEKLERDQVEQLKILNERIREMNDKADVNTGLQSRHVMTAEEQARLTRALTFRPVP